MTLLALTRADVASYVSTLIYVYLLLLLISIVLSYMERVPYNRWLDMFRRFIDDVTRPYLSIFRRFLTPLQVGPTALDLSPTIAIFVLLLLRPVIVSLIQG